MAEMTVAELVASLRRMSPYAWIVQAANKLEDQEKQIVGLRAMLCDAQAEVEALRKARKP